MACHPKSASKPEKCQKKKKKDGEMRDSDTRMNNKSWRKKKKVVKVEADPNLRRKITQQMVGDNPFQLIIQGRNNDKRPPSNTAIFIINQKFCFAYKDKSNQRLPNLVETKC